MKWFIIIYVFKTYILINCLKTKTYTGHTDNLERRLKEHNSGKSIFSRRHKPWKILHTEEFTNETEAIKREKYFKSAAGRRWIKMNLF